MGRSGGRASCLTRSTALSRVLRTASDARHGSLITEVTLPKLSVCLQAARPRSSPEARRRGVVPMALGHRNVSEVKVNLKEVRESLEPVFSSGLASLDLPTGLMASLHLTSRIKGGVDTWMDRFASEVDKDMSASLILHRAEFNHKDWEKHTSSDRRLRHLMTMASSEVIRALALPVSFVASVATALVFWNSLISTGLLPRFLPLLHVSNFPYGLATSVLSLLLVFRTNSSYSRFDEARKLSGSILNTTRDICRLALSYMARDQYAFEYPKREQFLRHLQAFPLAFKHHVLQEGSLESDLRRHSSLTEKEIQGLLAATDRPNYCLLVMAECLSRCHMSSASRLSMEQNLTAFADSVGDSERIFNTPIPRPYTRLTSQLLCIWHLFLPFVLYDALGWLTIPATILHTGVYFCIEEVGIRIENPFPVLALDAIALSARNSVSELISAHQEVQNLVAGSKTSKPKSKPPPAASHKALRSREKRSLAQPEENHLHISPWEIDSARAAHSVRKMQSQRP